MQKNAPNTFGSCALPGPAGELMCYPRPLRCNGGGPTSKGDRREVRGNANAVVCVCVCVCVSDLYSCQNITLLRGQEFRSLARLYSGQALGQASQRFSLVKRSSISLQFHHCWC